MKTNRFSPPLLVLAFIALSSLSSRAEDWKTTDGKIYQDVHVVNVQPDTVTILHHDGGAAIPLANLPADLQKRFSFDADKARDAAKERVREDADNAKALQAEMDEARRMTEAHLAAENATADSGSSSAVQSTTGAHYTLRDLDATMHTLQSDDSCPAHYSISNLASSVHSLKDAPDATHHSIVEIASSGL
jgi:hypothetical protein